MDSSGRGFGRGLEWGVLYRVGDVNYVVLLHAALLRVFEARANVHAPRVYGEGAVPGWLLYLDAVEGLYTILLPELRRGAEIFIEAARAEATLKAFRGEKGAEELVERARKIVEKAVAEAGDLLLYTSRGSEGIAAEHIVYWLDRAVERLVENMEKAGLLMPRKFVRVGGAGGGGP